MTQIKIHRVLEGPFDSSDCPDYDDEAPFFWLEVLMEYEGELREMQLRHEDHDYLYEIVKHLKKPTLEPYIIGVEYVEGD